MKKFFLFLFIIVLFFVLPIKVWAATDTDGDGLSDETETALGTDPANSDSDQDGFADGVEAKNGYNPLKGNKARDVERRLEVDLATQSLKVFMNDVEVGKVLVSTGMKILPTPVGTFSIMRKRPVVHYKGPGYDLPNTKWNLEFTKGYYIHGAYWHNQFGVKPVSHGCVNIAYKDMESIYSFMSVGDSVKIYGKAPEKPLVLTKK
jgi:hypothetical protein